MKKLSTIQKRNKLNDVHVIGDKGPGGAYHKYNIVTHVKEDECHELIESICFQKGPRSSQDSDSINGVIDTDLLEIVRHRLQCFQEGNLSSRENSLALTHIEQALMWLNKRVEDRDERNVLGKMDK